MSNSASLSVKFLRDENVKLRMEKFLKKKGFDIISKPKGLANCRLAAFSKSEQRVLITNDEDFSNSEHFPKEKLFSVIWLKIPQDKPEQSLISFLDMLEKINPKDFEGNLITLYENKFTIESIPSAE